LKSTSLPLPAAVTALLTAAIFAVTTVAQTPAPAAGGPPAESHMQHMHMTPTNLQVLPKTMTGEEVHELMDKWAGSLGVHCDTCHVVDTSHVGPNGRPRMNFADDSKPEKRTARIMYTMTEDINKNYIGKIDNTGAVVACGTCHRGHLGPEPFVIPSDDDHDHDHGASVPGAAAPSTAK
jgi:hypothetical protein